jgi:hypothetical protein
MAHPFSFICVLALSVVMPSFAQSPAKEDKPTIQELGKVVLDAITDATEAVRGVKDRATAEKAKDKIAEVEKKLTDPFVRDKYRTDEELRWVKDVFEPKLIAHQLELENAQDKLVETNSKLYAVIGSPDTFGEMKEAKIKRAELQTQKLFKACKVYYVMLDQGWPKKLTDLAETGDLARPLIEGGSDAIKDPWGQKYKLTIVEDKETGDEIPVISTVSPYGDGKQVIRWPKKEK